MSGTVYLIGAGPGDPGLITVRGRDILRRADVVIYDRLIGAELLEECRADAEKVFVGKAAAQHALPQEEINALLVERALQGKSVCRLKGGDPFVFGRGGEEALHCRAHGVPFEIVPGVTSSIAAPAYAGIPVTERADQDFPQGATSFAVVTGHTKDDDAPPPQLPVADTLVFLMGVRALPKIVAQLLARGEAATTPVALVRWGTTFDQQVVTGTLQTIEDEVARSGLKPPALIVVGNVVNLREKLQWFDNRPLWGQNIVVTRAREQASGLVEDLRALGARVIQCPTIRVENLDDYSVADKAIADLASYDWIVFTSTNGVDKFWERLKANGKDSRALGTALIAAIGPATAEALQARGIVPDFVPQSSISEDVARGMLERGVQGQRVLIARALEGREALQSGLSAGGAVAEIVPLYRTVPDASRADEVREKLQTGDIHWVTFTSSSTVRNFVDAIGDELLSQTRTSFRVAAIGPVTAETARELGLEPDVIAPTADVHALAQTIRDSLA